jgi:hypothetical protein
MKLTVNISDQPETNFKRKVRCTMVQEKEAYVELELRILVFKVNNGDYGNKIDRLSKDIVYPNTMYRYLDSSNGTFTIPTNIDAIRLSPTTDPVYDPAVVSGTDEFTWWENIPNNTLTGNKHQERTEDKVGRFIARLDAAGYFN